MPVDEGLGSVMDDVDIPTSPALDDLHGVPDLTAGVPAGVDAGPTELLDVLDALVADVEMMRRRIRDCAAPGFLVPAADKQRAAEVERLLGEVSRVLAERA